MQALAVLLALVLIQDKVKAAPVTRTLLLLLPAGSETASTSALSEIAVDFINADVRFNASVRLQLVSAVSESTPMRSLASVGQVFASENVSGIIGPPYSRDAVLISAWAALVGVPVVSYSATAPSLGSPTAYPTFLRVVSDDSSAIAAAVSLLKSINVLQAAIVVQDDDYGLEGLAEFQAAASASGLNVLSASTFPALNCSANQALDATLRMDARYILLWAFGPCSKTVLLSAAAKGMVGPAYVWLLSDEATFAAGENATATGLFDGTVVVEPATAAAVANSESALRARILKVFAERYPDLSVNAPPIYALYAVDAVFLFAAALSAMPARLGRAQTSFFERVMSNEATAQLMDSVRGSAGWSRVGSSQ